MIRYENGPNSLVDDCAGAIPGFEWDLTRDDGDSCGMALGVRYIDNEREDVPAWGARLRSVSVERHFLCSEDSRDMDLTHSYYVEVSIEFEYGPSHLRRGFYHERSGLTVSAMVYGFSIEAGYIGAVEQLSGMMSKGLPVLPNWGDLQGRGL